jgi:hypothetical protein
LHPRSAERQGGGDSAPIGDSTSRNNRHIHRVDQLGNEGHGHRRRCDDRALPVAEFEGAAIDTIVIPGALDMESGLSNRRLVDWLAVNACSLVSLLREEGRKPSAKSSSPMSANSCMGQVYSRPSEAVTAIRSSADLAGRCLSGSALLPLMAAHHLPF